MIINLENSVGPEATERFKASIQRQQVEEHEEAHKVSALLKRISDDIDKPESDPEFLPVFAELELLLQPVAEGPNDAQNSTAVILSIKPIGAPLQSSHSLEWQ